VFKEDGRRNLIEFINGFNAVTLVVCNRSITDYKGGETTRQCRTSLVGWERHQAGDESRLLQGTYKSLVKLRAGGSIPSADLRYVPRSRRPPPNLLLHKKICSESFMAALSLDIGTDNALRCDTVCITEMFGRAVKAMKL